MKTIFRWIALLPGSIIGAFLATIVLHFIFYKTLTGSGIVTPYPTTPERVLSPLAAALAIVWCGSSIAPKYNVETAVILLAAVVFISGASLAIGFTHGHIGGVAISVELYGLPNLAAILGAFVGLHLIRRQY